jgi:hypothetical protein
MGDGHGGHLIAFAGKPAPTEVRNSLRIRGSGLASEQPGTDGTADIAAKAAPTQSAADTPTKHYPGLGPCCEYRAADLPGLRRRWKGQGISHALIAQDGHFKTGFKRRVLRLLWRPPAPPASLVPSPLSSTCRGVS